MAEEKVLGNCGRELFIVLLFSYVFHVLLLFFLVSNFFNALWDTMEV